MPQRYARSALECGDEPPLSIWAVNQKRADESAQSRADVEWSSGPFPIVMRLNGAEHRSTISQAQSDGVSGESIRC
jgi:hypothetical protein